MTTETYSEATRLLEEIKWRGNEKDRIKQCEDNLNKALNDPYGNTDVRIKVMNSTDSKTFSFILDCAATQEILRLIKETNKFKLDLLLSEFESL